MNETILGVGLKNSASESFDAEDLEQMACIIAVCGDELMELDKPTDAAALYRQAAEISEASGFNQRLRVNLIVTLGELLTELGEFTAAREWLRKATETADTLAAGHRGRFCAYSALAKLSRDAEEYAEADKYQSIATCASELAAAAVSGEPMQHQDGVLITPVEAQGGDVGVIPNLSATVSSKVVPTITRWKFRRIAAFSILTTVATLLIALPGMFFGGKSQQAKSLVATVSTSRSRGGTDKTVVSQRHGTAFVNAGCSFRIEVQAPTAARLTVVCLHQNGKVSVHEQHSSQPVGPEVMDAGDSRTYFLTVTNARFLSLSDSTLAQSSSDGIRELILDSTKKVSGPVEMAEILVTTGENP